MYDLKYIELKTGYGDSGPAWIGRVRISRTGTTVYFNDHAFHKCHDYNGNYYDMESGEVYWISGVKKNGQDRHWAGCGPITIDRKVIDEYLSVTGMTALDPKKYIIVDIEDRFPVERITARLNSRRSEAAE